MYIGCVYGVDVLLERDEKVCVLISRIARRKEWRCGEGRTDGP